MPIVVAIDGPAGSGKSSVSKAVAERLGYGYLDTGAGYRAFALHAINNPGSSLEELLNSFDYEISLDSLRPQVLLAGVDVTGEIRTQEVASRVSEFAREQRVRALQHQDARTRIALCGLQGVVSEGRDLTTVVFADADVRILLTASEEVRLQRRSAEKTESTENLKARDASDSKVVEFMAPAEGVKL
ncbi:MAG: (d)CMP kinase, partial [Actinobacteria bacterium]|nr:(d)CMP kinase [Actinomycetota bacterium]